MVAVSHSEAVVPDGETTRVSPTTHPDASCTVMTFGVAVLKLVRRFQELGVGFP